MPIRYIAGFISAFYNPLQVPNAPTIGTATNTLSGGTVSITFTAPTNVGGGAITGYIATARRTSDGVTVSATGASSPITITGLTNGSAYTITVAAVNSFGPSASSANSNSVTPTLLAVGDAYQGGYFAGKISTAGTGVADFNLVVAPLSSGQFGPAQWKNSNTATPGADSDINGPQNTADMVADGNSTVYPCAHFCNDLVAGGFSDWYMPAKNELEICYFNLKPTTTANNTSVGTNPNAVPARASNYTSGTPAQTSAAVFQTGGAEAFFVARYWHSTEFNAQGAAIQAFSSGNQYGRFKTGNYYVRAIRRVAV